MRIQSTRTLRVLGVLAGAALLGGAIAAAPASAAPAKPGGATGSWNSHCVIKMAPGVNKSPARSCFGTFTQAISFATAGVVTDAPAQATASKALTAKIEAANDSHAAQAAPVLVGTEYSGPNFTGWTLTLSGSVSCTGPTDNVDYSLDLPSPIWDDIESFTNFNVCFTDHYFLSNFTPPRTGFVPSQASVPLMNIDGGPFDGNNNTRSITWS